MNKENQDRGLLLINLGLGKGKTTAALGTAIRSLGQNLKVAFIQFIKSTDTGESLFLEKLAQKESNNIFYQKFGAGFVGKIPSPKDIKAAEDGFKFVQEIVGKVDLLVLDEMGAVLEKKLLDQKLVYNFILERPLNLNMILTGRTFPDEFIKLADTVTDMTVVKHAYQSDIDAKLGIEF